MVQRAGGAGGGKGPSGSGGEGGDGDGKGKRKAETMSDALIPKRVLRSHILGGAPEKSSMTRVMEWLPTSRQERGYR